MNRTAWLQDRSTQKFRDVLSRWDAGELSMMEAGELLGVSERQFRRYGTAVGKTGLRGFVTAGTVSRRRNGCRPALASRASRLSERGPRQSPTAGWSILYRLRSTEVRTLALIEPSSQADRAFNPTLSAGTHLGVRNLAPKHLGRKETTWNYLQC